jgi:putative ABC transport system ATP-binding protein
MLMLEVRAVSKEYKREGHPFFAVDGAELSAESGEFIGIKGASGSGKSTLLNLIAGLLVPSSGEIIIDGQNIGRMNDKEVSAFRSRVIGYVPQGQSLLPNLTVYDNIRLPFYLSQTSHKERKTGSDNNIDADKRVSELLERFGISHLAESMPQSLSGGELRRAAIARAVISSPKILLADEPTSDLDTDNTSSIISFFREIADSGTAVIVVTHQLDTIENADRVYTMSAGKLTI